MAQRVPLSAHEISRERVSETLGKPITLLPSKRIARNRFLKTALTEFLSTFEPNNALTHGIPTDRLVNVYEKFGNGGYGIILTGNVMVHPQHLEAAGNAIIAKEIYSDHRHSQFAKMARASKSDGALAVVQLSHPGARTPQVLNPSTLSSSNVPIEPTPREGVFGAPVPMTIEQIKAEVIDRFAYAAKFLHSAGFDGIQLQGAHDYIFNQFWSSKYNHRTDHYGGSLENRLRLIRETYEAIRKVVPVETGFVVGIKLNSGDFQSDKHTPEEGLAIIQAIDQIGFDFLELFGGVMEPTENAGKRESTIQREAFYFQFGKQLRANLYNTKLYLGGGFRTLPAMVAAFENNETDGIGLGRPTTAEPDIAWKILEKGIQSVASNPFASDFFLTYCASQTQMFQMGSTTMAQANGDPCHGIFDLSAMNVAQNYAKALEKFISQILIKKEISPVVFEYVTCPTA
jgi:2,4-dienoyl-CoA reductase-like NADH-dependent reductase (Old Yellow Enzyme family)